MKKIKENEVRWGVLGVGNVCEIKSAPAMNLIPHSSLGAVMRRDARKAADYAKRHNVPKWYDNAGDLINDPGINAIYIATPPNAHLELTRQAAAAGKPVYVEKPMARTHAECMEMIDICDSAGVPLYVAYYRRRLPNFLKVKQLVETGSIGDVRMVEVRMRKQLEPDIAADNEFNWRVDPDLAGGGYFYDLASHQLDFLDYLFGPVIEASGFAANQAGMYKAEDIVTGSFRFENGVLGTGSWCFTASEASDSDITIITGSKGEISYPTFGEGWVEIRTDGFVGTDEFILPTHIQQPLIETIVEDLLGFGSCPSTGITGARTNLVMERLAYDAPKPLIK